MDDKQELMTVEKLSKLVYEIRGKQIMLSLDLAELYGYTTKRFTDQVISNIEMVFVLMLGRNSLSRTL